VRIATTISNQKAGGTFVPDGVYRSLARRTGHVPRQPERVIGPPSPVMETLGHSQISLTLNT